MAADAAAVANADFGLAVPDRTPPPSASIRSYGDPSSVSSGSRSASPTAPGPQPLAARPAATRSAAVFRAAARRPGPVRRSPLPPSGNVSPAISPAEPSGGYAGSSRPPAGGTPRGDQDGGAALGAPGDPRRRAVAVAVGAPAAPRRTIPIDRRVADLGRAGGPALVCGGVCSAAVSSGGRDCSVGESGLCGGPTPQAPPFDRPQIRQQFSARQAVCVREPSVISCPSCTPTTAWSAGT